jgi:MOSC domain-containing protein YiiM
MPAERAAARDGRLVSINTSAGGVPKRPLPAAEAWIGRLGVTGDQQRDRRYHGGPDRAVTLYSAELLAALHAEGHSLEAGSLGENLTVAGIEWSTLAPGIRLRVGDATLELTRPAAPCSKLAACFANRDFNRVSDERHPGWSRLCARVLKEGQARVGDSVEILAPDESGRRSHEVA